MANTYVLVHGAWHGGWCWTAVIKRLREEGHTVYAPTLVGHGPDEERAGITQDACVSFLVQYIEERDLQNVILVGHSWGGTVLCGAAPRLIHRLRHLIFWSAFVLEDGTSVFDSVPPHYGNLFRSLAARTSDNTVLLPWEMWRSGFMQDNDEQAARLAYHLLIPEPLNVFEAKLDQRAFFNLDIPKSFIRGLRDGIALPHEFWEQCQRRLGEHQLLEIDSSHEACFTHPIELAETLMKASIQ